MKQHHRGAWPRTACQHGSGTSPQWEVRSPCNSGLPNAPPTRSMTLPIEKRAATCHGLEGETGIEQFTNILDPSPSPFGSQAKGIG
eukprot:3995441-Amphidinium_carterae.2